MKTYMLLVVLSVLITTCQVSATEPVNNYPFRVQGCCPGCKDEEAAEMEANTLFFGPYVEARAYARTRSRRDPDCMVLTRVDPHDDRWMETVEWYEDGHLDIRVMPDATRCSRLPPDHPCRE